MLKEKGHILIPAWICCLRGRNVTHTFSRIGPLIKIENRKSGILKAITERHREQN